jgi:hypothetical protein
MAIEQQFGELVFAYTTSFDLRWNDKGSGGKYDGAFWQPKPPSGFHALGGIGVAGYYDVNGNVAALCARAADPNSQRPPLARPTAYDRIWKDKGSGAKMDGSCWRPRAPSGYVAMGDVFATGHDTPPSLDDAICVRADLTHQAVAGDFIWDDKDTGSDVDFGAWLVAAPPAFVDPTLGLIAANTYVGVPSHDKPSTDPVLNVLMVPMPNEIGQEPAEPSLDGYEAPPQRTPSVVDRIVTVPFTAIVDDSKDLAWKVAHSPFYTIQRSAWYSLAIFEHNKTSVAQSKGIEITLGVSTTTSNTYSVATGISVTAEAGVSFIVDAKVSATVSVELGFEHSTSVSELQSTTVTRSLIIPARTAAALWVASYSLQAVRADGAQIYQPLNFDVESFVSDQFPTASPRQEKVQVLNIDPNKIGTPVQA